MQRLDRGDEDGQGGRARPARDELLPAPATIQPHGLLFALEAGELRIAQCSANVVSALGFSPHALRGTPFGALFTAEGAAALTELTRAGVRERVSVALTELRGAQYEAQLHMAPSPRGVLIAELEPRLAEPLDFHPRLRAALDRLQGACDGPALWQQAAQEVRALTGFERVLVLLFEPDGGGRVAAEARDPRLCTMEGQRFAPGELPAPTGAHHARSWLRMVPDVEAPGVELTPRLHPLGALDLSHARLRSFSPPHIAYLRERGVRASLSASLVVGGALRGLIACHHYSAPHRVSRAARDALELLGQLLSFQLHTREQSARLEQQLAQRAGSADLAKDVFIANVSHELRTPLNAIAGWADMLQSGAVPSERVSHALEVIARNARAQTQLVEDLIAVSGMSHGGLPLATRSLELAEVVRAALQAIELAAQNKELRVEMELAAGCRVLGDPTRLQQVVTQLCSNAVKFTPRGGHVQVTLCPRGADVELRVRDSGVGIAPSFLPLLFSPFRQQDEGPARMQQGLGIGLRLVRQIVELHGGSVRAESAGEGMGATFTVTLPCPAHAV